MTARRKTGFSTMRPPRCSRQFLSASRCRFLGTVGRSCTGGRGLVNQDTSLWSGHLNRRRLLGGIADGAAFALTGRGGALRAFALVSAGTELPVVLVPKLVHPFRSPAPSPRMSRPHPRRTEPRHRYRRQGQGPRPDRPPRRTGHRHHHGLLQTPRNPRYEADRAPVMRQGRLTVDIPRAGKPPKNAS